MPEQTWFAKIYNAHCIYECLSRNAVMTGVARRLGSFWLGSWIKLEVVEHKNCLNALDFAVSK